MRYQVEKVNGNVKLKYKYFSQVISNLVVSELFNDFKVACALYNLTFSPSVVTELEKDIAYTMLERSNQPNLLQILIKTENLNARHSNFESIEDSQIDFSRFDLNDLYRYVCGSYQIRMASRYYFDHLSYDGDFYFQIAKETANIDFRKYGIDLDMNNSLLLKTRIRSRHSNSVKYYVYVLLDTRLFGLQSIVGHSCGCKIGNRVNGCCSHITMIIWFFSYARFRNINKPGIHEDDVFQSNLQLEESEDEDL